MTEYYTGSGSGAKGDIITLMVFDEAAGDDYYCDYEAGIAGGSGATGGW